MIEMLSLRDYQREAVDAIDDAHTAGMRFPAVVLPCGSGKSVITAHLAAENLAAHNNRVLVLAHRDELLDQVADKIRRVAPSLSVGKVKADDDDVFADVVVASVQTAARPLRLARLVASQKSSPDRKPRQFGLVVTDECHRAAAMSYGKIYDALPRARKAGFTATLSRGDGVGLGSVIDDVVYSKSWLWMIKNGYLVDPVGQVVSVDDLDLSGVRRSGGDYAAGSLGDAMIDTGAPDVIASAYRRYASNRSGVVFTPTVAAAYGVREALADAGTTAAVVDGNTPRAERLRIYEDSRTGRVQVIVNCAVLTEGFDAPWVSAVVPPITRSEGRFQQSVGRSMRLYPGKTDALVLSVGGMSGRLCTLVDLQPGSVKEIRPGESLTDAEAREETAAETVIPGSAKGFGLKVKHVDMFSASKSLWLRTDGGVMFVPVADGEVFLWKGEDGLWDVRHAPRPTARLKIRWPKLYSGLSLEMAMAWGEAAAEDMGTTATGTALSTRSASWRRKKEPPSPGQIDAARYLDVVIPEGATKAEVSDLLSVRTATLKFDPFAARLAARDSQEEHV
jgi:superfamily II DNA or RNA helicase